jgi:hypothetical protein
MLYILLDYRDNRDFKTDLTKDEVNAYIQQVMEEENLSRDEAINDYLLIIEEPESMNSEFMESGISAS